MRTFRSLNIMDRAFFRRDTVVRVGGIMVVLDDMIHASRQLLRMREAIKLFLRFLDGQAQLSRSSHYGQWRCTLVKQIKSHIDDSSLNCAYNVHL